MKRKTTKSDGADPIEHKCPACSGTGFPAVVQPMRPGRRIYPAPCARQWQGADTRKIVRVTHV
jgi:hypothetical protein